MNSKSMINLLNTDCMEFLKGCKDKEFDLAVVDPPYGGGQHFNFRFGTGDQVYDSRKPDQNFFDELFRVSKNQIVWGGNYFAHNLPVNRGWIAWYKGQPIDSFSDFELAWSSFDRVAKSIKLESYGFNHADKKIGKEKTIHPTQKPVALYKWIFHHYAKAGDKILDTHLGSGSSAIAAHYAGLDFTGTEIDKDYFNAALKRFKTVTSQQILTL